MGHITIQYQRPVVEIPSSQTHEQMKMKFTCRDGCDVETACILETGHCCNRFPGIMKESFFHFGFMTGSTVFLFALPIMVVLSFIMRKYQNRFPGIMKESFFHFGFMTGSTVFLVALTYMMVLSFIMRKYQTTLLGMMIRSKVNLDEGLTHSRSIKRLRKLILCSFCLKEKDYQHDPAGESNKSGNENSLLEKRSPVIPRVDNIDDATNKSADTFKGFQFRRNASEFGKDHDDTEDMETLAKIVSCSHSVGFIYSSVMTGTAFRVGTKCIMTALHIIRYITKKNPKLLPGGTGDILQNQNVWVQFDYEVGDEKKPFNEFPQRFMLKKVLYDNTDLDVAVVELEVKNNQCLPPQFRCFTDHAKFDFIGHDGGREKKRDPRCRIVNISEEDLQKASQWCESNGQPADSYHGVNGRGRVYFHCMFRHGASGSPGVAVLNNQVYVVTFLIKGYPRCFYESQAGGPVLIQKNFMIEEGVKITAVFEDMEQKDMHELLQDIVTDPNIH